jgi:hypothetical protein
MKNYRVSGFLFASISLQLSGMFLGVDDILRSAEELRGENKYSETISVVKEGPDTANFVFSLSAVIPGRIFGYTKMPLAKIIVKISESLDKNAAINAISVSFDLSSEVSQRDENKQFAESWSKDRQKFVEIFFGKDKTLLTKDSAELKAENFYKDLKFFEEDDQFSVEKFLESLSKKVDKPVTSAALASKLEELFQALNRLLSK